MNVLTKDHYQKKGNDKSNYEKDVEKEEEN